MIMLDAPLSSARAAPAPAAAHLAEAVSSLRPPVLREVPQQPAHALGGVVLLGGAVWKSGLRAAVDRPLFELPVTAEKSLLDIWCERIGELADALGRAPLPTRILLTQGSPSPDRPARPHVTLTQDSGAFRGTGGALRDLTAEDPAETSLLVANAAQLPLEPLFPLVRQLIQRHADVSFVAHYDGTPARVMVLRPRCLRVLPRVGFVDLMEQGLPLIAREHPISAVHCAHPVSLPVRTLQGYIRALQRYHRRSPGVGGGEEWRSSFSLIEPGAEVHPSACLHDTVVLRGGRVNRNAVVARSVVCPGAIVPRGAVVVDEVVASASGRMSLSWSS